MYSPTPRKGNYLWYYTSDRVEDVMTFLRFNRELLNGLVIEGVLPSGDEITADVQQLLDDGKIALGIEDSHSLPPSDLGWEGGQVLAAPVAFKAPLYTDNPIHSNMADLSVFPFAGNPSPSVHSRASRESRATVEWSYLKIGSSPKYLLEV